MNKKLFIDSYIEKISKRFKLTNDLAFEIFVNSIILNKDFDDIFENISTIEKGKKGQWTGSNDGGFDGICIDEDELSLVVIQIKNQTNFGDNEISKFINDFENIFIYDNRANIKLNKTVVSKKDEYISIIKSGYIIEPKLYFVFNGEIDHKNQERIKNFSNSCEYLEILDSNLLYEKIESIVFQNKTRKNIEFSFKAQKSNISFKNDPQGLISYSLANVKAVNFRLEALELCKLLDKEKSINKNIDTLFSKNIRGYLGQNKTNNKIKQTLLGEDAEYFPFLNNGITVIAQIVNIPKQMNAGIYNIATTNPVIVNGLQTTRVMYDVYQKDSSMLEDVYIIVRLYETNGFIPELCG